MARNKNELEMEIIGQLSLLEYKVEGIIKDLEKINVDDKSIIENYFNKSLKKISTMKELRISELSKSRKLLEMRDGIPDEAIGLIQSLCLKQTKLASDEIEFLHRKTDVQLSEILNDPIYLKRLKTIV